MSQSVVNTKGVYLGFNWKSKGKRCPSSQDKEAGQMLCHSSHLYTGSSAGLHAQFTSYIKLYSRLEAIFCIAYYSHQTMEIARYHF